MNNDITQNKNQPGSRGLLMLLLVLAVTLTAGMTLSGCGSDEAEEMKTETAAQGEQEKELWTCGMHPEVIQDKPGNCPICGMKLTPVKASTTEQEKQEKEKELWTCSMHPEVIQDKPGNCPICGMKLTPVKSSTMEKKMDMGGGGEGMDEPGKGKKILYWRAPMDPTYIKSEPGKSPMGMDLVPVYEGDENYAGRPSVMIDPVTVHNIGVQTAPVKKMNLSRVIRTVGHVDYNEESIRRVNLKFSGWIEKLYIDETGQHVKKGDRMAEIYSPELVQTQQEYLLAYRNLKKTKNSSFQEVSSGSESLLESVRKRLEYWDVTDRQIRDLEERGTVSKTVTLYAPFDGIVISKMAETGMKVMQGMDLYRIADISTVWVLAHVYDYELPWVKVGQEVTMDLPYLPGKTFRGTVDFIYPYLDMKARDVKIRLVFRNPGYEFKPQMYANVMVESRIGNAVTAIPNEAVLRSGKRNVVFVDGGSGKFEPRDVVLGPEGQDGLVQVLAGVNEGEDVVTSAQFLLDSESRLKEAIQKMLESRRTLDQPKDPQEGNMDEMKGMDHQHEGE